MSESVEGRYSQREVVGVLANAKALEAVVDALESAGFSRPAISVLCADEHRPASMATPHKTADQLADDPQTHREAFVSSDSQTQIKALAVALPFQIGAFGGVWASMAAGGALAAALGTALVTGGIGAGLGALLVHAVAKHHADSVHAQLADGGAILWVATPDEYSERRATKILEEGGAKSVHSHTLSLAWGASATPLHDAQPDPFLGGGA